MAFSMTSLIPSRFARARESAALVTGRLSAAGVASGTRRDAFPIVDPSGARQSQFIVTFCYSAAFKIVQQ